MEQLVTVPSSRGEAAAASKRREGGGKNGPKLRGRVEEKAVSEAKLEERPLSGTNSNQETFTAAGICQAMGVEGKEFSRHCLFSGVMKQQKCIKVLVISSIALSSPLCNLRNG